MADKQIVELPSNQAITDETLFPAYQPGAVDPAQKVTGAQLAEFAEKAGAEAGRAAAGEVERGATFTPHFDESTGLLSWTNDLGLPNPDPMQLSGVTAFNGRSGAVTPQSGDYTAAMVGAAFSGFGLGEVMARLSPVNDEGAYDADLIDAGGFWRCTANGAVSGWFDILHVPHSVGHATQIGTPIYGSELYVRTQQSGVWGEWSKPLATTDYAVNKAGDTMTGNLFLNDGYACVTGGAGLTSLWAYANPKDASNRRNVTLYPTLDPSIALKYEYAVDGVVGQQNILHTGNKPSGSYTGTGAPHSVKIGVEGTAVLIASDSGFAVIKYDAAGTHIGTTGTITSLTGANCWWNTVANGGDLSLEGDSVINRNGTVYKWAVI